MHVEIGNLVEMGSKKEVGMHIGKRPWIEESSITIFYRIRNCKDVKDKFRQVLNKSD